MTSSSKAKTDLVSLNMLENALKYSVDAPKIDVYTESTNKFFILKIKDEGIGMSKNVQKQVFDKLVDMICKKMDEAIDRDSLKSGKGMFTC